MTCMRDLVSGINVSNIYFCIIFLLFWNPKRILQTLSKTVALGSNTGWGCAWVCAWERGWMDRCNALVNRVGEIKFPLKINLLSGNIWIKCPLRIDVLSGNIWLTLCNHCPCNSSHWTVSMNHIRKWRIWLFFTCPVLSVILLASVAHVYEVQTCTPSLAPLGKP